MLVSELLTECYSLNPVKAPTLVNWTKAIRPIKDCKIEAITKRDVQMYIVKHWRNKQNPMNPWGDRTMKQRIQTLRALWNMGIEWEFIEGYNPWIKAGSKIKNYSYKGLSRQAF